MPVAPKVVIFDFDGTVADTMPFLVDLAARLLSSRYGLPDSEARRAYIETTGLPFCRQIEIIFPGNPLNEATVREFEGEKLSHLGDFEFFPEALAALAEIRSRGVKVCLSSGNYESLIKEVLASRGVVVDLVMGFKPGFEKGPQHFQCAAAAFEAGRDQVVFVGDSIKDGLAAREAGIAFIARAGLVQEEEIRRRLPGVPVVNSLTEVLPLLGLTIARVDPGKAPSPRAATS